jgi:hypothetical protein
VPHLAFYATSDDVALIMAFVLDECRVFESYSMPDLPLRNLASPLEVRDVFDSTRSRRPGPYALFAVYERGAHR